MSLFISTISPVALIRTISCPSCPAGISSILDKAPVKRIVLVVGAERVALAPVAASVERSPL